jgi:hypothetical protein
MLHESDQKNTHLISCSKPSQLVYFTCTPLLNFQRNALFWQQSPSWEVTSHSASQEIPRLLWNPKVHYRVQRKPFNSKAQCNISKQAFFYGEELSASRPISKLSATAYSIYSQLPSIPGGRLLHPQPKDASCNGDKGPIQQGINTNIFTATLHIWRPSPPSTTCGRSM